MSSQLPESSTHSKQNMMDNYMELLYTQNVFYISSNARKNLAALIFAIILLALLLRNVSTLLSQLVLTFKKVECQKTIPQAKLLLPVRIPVVDPIYHLIKLRKDGVLAFEECFKKFGKLYEIPIGPITVTVTSDPTILQKLLSSNQMTHLNKPPIYSSVLGNLFHNGLLTSENEIWSAQRKMLGRCFTYKSLQNYAVFMNRHAANLTNMLLHECENKGENYEIGVQRINALLYRHSFRIIAQIVMRTDGLSADESKQVSKAFIRAKHLIADRILNPWKYLWFLPKRREYNRTHNYLNDFYKMVTQKYKKEYEDTKVTTSDHAQHNSEDESVGIKPFRCMIEEMLCAGASDMEIHQQVGTILGTGHDTTVVAIKMLMLHLALNPVHQAACREEIDKIINEKGCNQKTKSSCDEIDCFNLTMEDLNDLKYLERCIWESGRITSVVPFYMRRVDTPLKIDNNLEFPAGTTFVICNWTLHRDKNMYPDPLKFDPDRFLAENVKKRHPYSYTPFSLGPRKCIGWKVAIMQIKVTMAYILRHFEIFSDDKLENVRLYFGVTIVPEREYRVTLKRRVQ